MAGDLQIVTTTEVEQRIKEYGIFILQFDKFTEFIVGEIIFEIIEKRNKIIMNGYFGRLSC